MNLEKPRMPTRDKLRETKFQKYLSCAILYKEKKENNKLKKPLPQINYYRRTSFVGVPLLFGDFEADFDRKFYSGDIWQLCKHEHMPR